MDCTVDVLETPVIVDLVKYRTDSSVMYGNVNGKPGDFRNDVLIFPQLVSKKAANRSYLDLKIV